jgi:hypothetical protein
MDLGLTGTRDMPAVTDALTLALRRLILLLFQEESGN